MGARRSPATLTICSAKKKALHELGKAFEILIGFGNCGIESSVSLQLGFQIVFADHADELVGELAPFK